ncbi:MAG: 6-pyruvoyl tetrahydropterin synthase family protein [Thermoplasmata archaeon]|nr:6-pyruvoyl tetrahydropterin synthase family protein [Thermoplasmata archaeon]
MQLEIDGWRLRLTFSAAHVMIGHKRCGRLHGHDYAISVRLDGEPGKDGVILDFGVLKDIVRGIAKELDHKFLVAKRHKNVAIKNGRVTMRSGRSTYEVPLADCAVLDIEQTSAEEIASWVGRKLRAKLAGRANLSRLQVKVEEGMGQSVWLSVKL